MTRTDHWTRDDKDGLRASRPQREGLWIRLRRKHHFLCIPPRGAVLPWGIFLPLVKVPVVEQADTPLKDANREETLVRVFVDDAALWMDETFGPKLSPMLKPYNGLHDFVVLCGGIPVHVTSGDGRWSARFDILGGHHSVQDLDLEGLAAKMRAFFLSDFTVDIPALRIASVIDETVSAQRRVELMLEAVRCETIAQDAPSAEIQRATQRALGNCEVMKSMRRRDVELHRLAMGLADRPDRKLRQDFTSVEDLLSAAKAGL